MSESKVIINSAHTEGPTALAFSKDGLHAYTGGSDGLVRIWKTDQGGYQEPEVAAEADKGITSLSATNICWLSGSEDGEVRRYAPNKPQLEGLVTSSPAVSIRCVAINPQGNSVAVTSDELAVKIVDLEDITKVIILAGHTRAVRRASWHPSGSLLATCGSDGKIIIWDISEGEAKVESTIEGVVPIIRDNESLEFAHDCSAVWHPSGQYFFVASKAHEIITISRSTWSKSSTFSDDNVLGDITALALSANGAYLASSSKSTVYIWSTQNRRLLFHHPGEPNVAVTQLAFSPTQNLLAWTDFSGVLTRWPEPIPGSYPDPVKAQGVAAFAPVTSKRAPSPLFGEALSKPGPISDSGVDLDAIGDDVDDWMIDDVGILDEPRGEDTQSKGFVKEMVSITKAQPPFQPGSTPMENKRRFLAYNMIGVIEVTDQDTHHIVNVEFHDQSARKGYHFTDHFKYDMGYLGERGAVFACQPENEHPAQVVYKPYTTWTSQAEWSYPIVSKGVKVLGVAAGGMPVLDSLRRNADDDLQGFGNVVVATSDSDLTFLSGTGREKRILGLGSDFVTMIAGPEWVFVVHRTGSTTIDGSQNLSYSIINFEDFTVRQRDVLPIPKGHVLKWLGLTAEGAPAIYDSTERLHVLTKFRIPHHASWARILDTDTLERREGKDESYWPVGITGSVFMCLILKGRQEHPSFPRPLIQELPIRLPFRRNDPKDSPLEEQIARETLLLEMARDSLADVLTTDDISKREMAMDKELIQLIQAACKADNSPRAIELTKLLHHTISFDMAIKVAAFYHLVGLQEKMEILKANREEEEDRLEVARNKRRQWITPDPLPRHLPSSVSSSSKRADPLQDFGPPRPVYRPGLARAIPVAAPSHSSSNSHANGVHPNPEEPHIDPITPECKRKRSVDDEMDGEDELSKRRALDEPMATSSTKLKQNPFARKPVPDNGRNPFARKAEMNKTIQKSQSFFDKVDAVNVDADRPKGSLPQAKEKKKAAPRQATLFGLPPGQQPEKRGRSKKGDAKASASASINANAKESAQGDDAGTPSVSSTLVETQTTEDYSQQTEIGVDSQDQVQTKGSPESIEWLASPQATQLEGVEMKDP